MDKMTPSEQPMTDELAKKLGFINADAYANAKYIRAADDTTLAGQDAVVDAIIVRLVNLEQMVLESKRHIESLEARLVATGTERIG